MNETDYNNWSKEELIDKIRKLECHVKQLRNVVAKREPLESEHPTKRTKFDDDNGSLPPYKEREKKAPRPFDFSSVSIRHVALKFLYLGWDYQGLAVQEDTNETIEAHLFKALTLTRLIEDRSKSNYHRCGRTDKGVSAFCQVISIDLRSKIVDGDETLDYCKILNKTLPKDIRIIAWSPVRPDFSARFNCCRRVYKYFFPRGNLDIKNMVIGAQFLLGEHDFKNFCKIDKEQRTTMRKIITVDIMNDNQSSYNICHLVIVGESFLWHQIRCIVGILLLIGQGLEEPDVVKQLLDLDKNPLKPQYTMAIDYPLVLYEVDYPDAEGIKWTYTTENMTVLLGDLQSVWMKHSIKTEMTKEMLKDIEKLTTAQPTALTDSLIMGIIIAALLVCAAPPSFCQDEYVDFSDMGSYDHGSQANRFIQTDVESTKVSVRVLKPDQSIQPLQGIHLENGSRPMKFLQRVVKSLLRQMNVQKHVFGPGEAITIDLQAEIRYDDYIILNKFGTAEEYEEPNKYLDQVDRIMSNLVHVVEHSGSSFDYLEYILNLPMFNSLKFWLVMITMSVVCFLIIMLSLRTVYSANNLSMLFYGFLIIFILSCIWTFSYMYEDAIATNYAKQTQAQSPPKDCDYENLSFRDSISYFFRVHLFGYKDHCEQYYRTSMTDPFWSVNPLEAISKSFSVLVFAPFGYIGDKLGLFFGGVISGIPFWLQPLLMLLVFGFMFMSLFGYRIVSPLFTIEPARREYHDRGEIPGPAITDAVRNQLVKRPERKIMKSIKDASTDMDGFESYINGNYDNDTPRIECHHWIIEYLLSFWTILLNLLDTVLRQFPDENQDYEEEEEESDYEFANAVDVMNDPPAPVPNNQEEDVLIPRRRMHVMEDEEDEADEKANHDNNVPNDDFFVPQPPQD